MPRVAGERGRGGKSLVFWLGSLQLFFVFGSRFCKAVYSLSLSFSSNFVIYVIIISLFPIAYRRAALRFSELFYDLLVIIVRCHDILRIEGLLRVVSFDCFQIKTQGIFRR